MNKLLLVISFAFSSFLFSQEVVLTPNDYRDKNNTANNYVVIEFPEKSQNDLFIAVKKHLTSTYKNLNNGYNEVGNEQIVIDVNSSASTTKLLGVEMSVGEFVNRYEINFKDGKIMIRPSFQKLIFESVSGPDKEVFLTGGSTLIGKSIFNKKGSISIKESIFIGIQKRTNDFILSVANVNNQNNSNW